VTGAYGEEEKISNDGCFNNQTERVVMKKFPDMGKGSVALIFPQDPLLNVVAFISRSILPVRLYKPNERDMALEWLRSTIEARR